MKNDNRNKSIIRVIITLVIIVGITGFGMLINTTKAIRDNNNALYKQAEYLDLINDNISKKALNTNNTQE